MVTGNGSLTPICSISKRSLSPRLTVYRNLMIPYLQFTKCAGFLIEFLFLHFFFSGLTSIFGVFHSSKFIDLFLCFPILLISLTMFGSFWFVLGLKNKISILLTYFKSYSQLKMIPLHRFMVSWNTWKSYSKIWQSFLPV